MEAELSREPAAESQRSLKSATAAAALSAALSRDRMLLAELLADVLPALRLTAIFLASLCGVF